jgi:hypothetical protein
MKRTDKLSNQYQMEKHLLSQAAIRDWVIGAQSILL